MGTFVAKRWNDLAPDKAVEPRLQIEPIERYHFSLATDGLQALYAIVNSKQKRALAAIFADPVSPSIAWTAIESLLLSLGCELIEGNGSRVRFVKDGHVQTFHRPHPDPNAKRYQVRDAREYLRRLGIEP